MVTPTLLAIAGSVAAVIGVGLLLWSSIAGNRAATTDRALMRAETREGFTAAAADRESVRTETREGFAAATADRESIRTEMREGFGAILDRLSPPVETAAAQEDAPHVADPLTVKRRRVVRVVDK